MKDIKFINKSLEYIKNNKQRVIALSFAGVAGVSVITATIITLAYTNKSLQVNTAGNTSSQLEDSSSEQDTSSSDQQVSSSELVSSSADTNTSSTPDSSTAPPTSATNHTLNASKPTTTSSRPTTNNTTSSPNTNTPPPPVTSSAPPKPTGWIPTQADVDSIVSQAIAHGISLGLQLDIEVTPENGGWNVPMIVGNGRYEELGFDKAKKDVFDSVSWIKNKGYRVFNVIARKTNSNQWTIYVLY